MQLSGRPFGDVYIAWLLPDKHLLSASCKAAAFDLALQVVLQACHPDPRPEAPAGNLPALF